MAAQVAHGCRVDAGSCRAWLPVRHQDEDKLLLEVDDLTHELLAKDDECEYLGQTVVSLNAHLKQLVDHSSQLIELKQRAPVPPLAGVPTNGRPDGGTRQDEERVPSGDPRSGAWSPQSLRREAAEAAEKAERLEQEMEAQSHALSQRSAEIEREMASMREHARSIAAGAALASHSASSTVREARAASAASHEYERRVVELEEEVAVLKQQKRGVEDDGAQATKDARVQELQAEVLRLRARQRAISDAEARRERHAVGACGAAHDAPRNRSLTSDLAGVATAHRRERYSKSSSNLMEMATLNRREGSFDPGETDQRRERYCCSSFDGPSDRELEVAEYRSSGGSLTPPPALSRARAVTRPRAATAPDATVTGREPAADCQSPDGVWHSPEKEERGAAHEVENGHESVEASAVAALRDAEEVLRAPLEDRARPRQRETERVVVSDAEGALGERQATAADAHADQLEAAVEAAHTARPRANGRHAAGPHPRTASAGAQADTYDAASRQLPSAA